MSTSMNPDTGRTRLSSKPVIDRYAEGGPLLAQATSNLTAEQVIERPGDGAGAWSIAELVAHLLDADLVMAERMKRIIAEPGDNPTLQGFDENAWIARLDSHAMPVDEAVALFAASRKWMARILRSQEDATFARVGTHTERGRLTLAEVLVYATNHLDHHLKFLYAKRAKLGVAIYPRYTANPGN